ncbi:hypothetical protein A7P84_02725 [Eikenella corrodens]|uniref:hypothetical protein n=1 Tax=Eikenella corrodens TaxID=539 RepID=UPI0007D0A1A1|nr:hypothetical protein [Eikenella corrodens]OAM20142.1 hypothetical protein A7P84_02725 [Eikenella corrodens]
MIIAKAHFTFYRVNQPFGVVCTVFDLVGKIMVLAMAKVPVSGSLKFSGSLSCGVNPDKKLPTFP